MATPLIDLTGKRFGRWEVLSRHGDKSPPRWVCRCDCGTEKNVLGITLRDGESRSCGCIGAERFRSLRQTGDNNPARKSAKARHGKLLPPKDRWYGRACSIKRRCKENGIEFGFSSSTELAVYMKEIAPDKCPVFGFPFQDSSSGFSHRSPSADRIRPDLGYVRGNIQIISMKANTMKANASIDELKQFARWIDREAEKWP